MIKSVVFLLFASKVLSQNCTLDFSNSESPFIVNDDFTLPSYDKDKKQSLSFENDELFYVVCPTGTHSPYIAEKGDHLACKGGTNVLNIRTVEIIDFANVRCEIHGLSKVNKLGQQCGTNGTLFEIGFNIYNKFISMVTVCFDEVKLTPIYTKYNYSVLSDTWRYAEIKDPYFNESFVCGGIPCEWADNGNVYLDIDVDGAYNSQSDLLHGLGIYDVSLMRFPLTVGVLYMSESETRQGMQFDPYFDYMNVVPLWNIEDLVATIVYLIIQTSAEPSYVDPPFTIGTLGVATLANKEGNQVELYLKDGKIPVPKWVWFLWDKTEEIVFNYNSPNSEEMDAEITKLCSSCSELNSNACICDLQSVIDAEMRQLIENDFN